MAAALAALRARRSARRDWTILRRTARFAERVEACRRASARLSRRRRKREGKIVAAYGAAAKGNTLLNFCGVDAELILRWSPTAIRTSNRSSCRGRIFRSVSPEALMRATPDYVLILPWNLQDEIRRQLDGIRAWGGRFVIPVPCVRIVP